MDNTRPGVPQEPPPSASGARAARQGGIALGRLFGFPVRLSLSWLLLAGLVTVAYGQFLASTRTDLPRLLPYAIAFGLVVCLVLSVLLHELGHAFASRWAGIGVRGITLEMLGGYTEMERE